MHFESLMAYKTEIMYGGCKNGQCVLCVSSCNVYASGTSGHLIVESRENNMYKK